MIQVIVNHLSSNLTLLKHYEVLLAKPKDRERLLIYLVVSEVAVSAVLVWEYKGMQSLIYYISKPLLDAERGYPYLEN